MAINYNILQEDSIKIKNMNQPNQGFYSINGQIYIYSSGDQEEYFDQRPSTMNPSLINVQTNIQTMQGEGEGKDQDSNDHEEPEKFQAPKKQNSKKKKTKKNQNKRTDQNIVRSILRMREFINTYFTVNIQKFYDSSRQVYLFAIFRKFSKHGILQLLKNYLAQKFQVELENQFSQEEKDKKLVKYLKFLFTLTEVDLCDQEMQNTKKRMKEQTQRRSQPIKFTLEQLSQIQALIIKRV